MTQVKVIPLSAPALEAELRTMTESGETLPALSMCCPACGFHRVMIPYAPQRRALSNSHPVWKHVSGDTLDTITLTPSYRLLSGCKLHGWVRNGTWVHC